MTPPLLAVAHVVQEVSSLIPKILKKITECILVKNFLRQSIRVYNWEITQHTYIHTTYGLRNERVAETSQILFQVTHILP
jgi:hypothetical protein